MKKLLLFLILILFCATATVKAQEGDEGDRIPLAAGKAAKQLASPDPLTRQLAAEELARLAAVDQLRLVDGYRAQEKDKQVRLALDWALYRLGRPEKLYAVVSELEGKRSKQATGYLAQVEGPQLLYPFLRDATGKTLVGLLDALGKLGTAETLPQIKVYQSNFDPAVATAAKAAETEIAGRLAETPVNTGSRDRVVTAPADSAKPAEPESPPESQPQP